MQKLLTQACTSVINIANNYVEANKSNNIVESRDFVTKTADAITILTKLNTMLTNERKKKIKTSTFWELQLPLWPGVLPVSIYFREPFTRKAQKSQILTLLGGYNFENIKNRVSVNLVLGLVLVVSL